MVLSYAIADVARFVEPGGAIDQEAWRRGVTVYLPDGRATSVPAAPRPTMRRACCPTSSVRRSCSRVRIAPTALVGPRRRRAFGHPEPGEAGLRDGDARRPPAGISRAGPPDRAGRDRPRGRAHPGARAGGDPDASRVRCCASGRDRRSNGRARRCRWRRTWRSPTGCSRRGPACSGRCRVSTTRSSAGSVTSRVPSGSIGPPACRSATTSARFRADDMRTGAFQLAVRRAGGSARYEPYREGVVPWHAAVAATVLPRHGTVAPARRSLRDRGGARTRRGAPGTAVAARRVRTAAGRHRAQ